MTENLIDDNWIPLKISAIEYPKDDLIGKLLAFVSLSHVVILSGFITLITFRRDLHTITVFAGLLLNELLCCVLKYVIAEPRPLFRNSEKLYTEYGMPSSHTQLMWYLSVYLFYFMFIRTNYIKTDFATYLWKILVTVVFFVWAILMAISRVYLKYHTIKQVIGGAIVGTVFATFWFIITHYVLTPYFPVVASWRISELLLIRDTTLIPNILWFEYTSASQEVRTRQRKSVSRKSQ